jgi:hypothetical protein
LFTIVSRKTHPDFSESQEEKKRISYLEYSKDPNSTEAKRRIFYPEYPEDPKRKSRRRKAKEEIGLTRTYLLSGCDGSWDP